MRLPKKSLIGKRHGRFSVFSQKKVVESVRRKEAISIFVPTHPKHFNAKLAPILLE
jgi:hypothetical protein